MTLTVQPRLIPFLAAAALAPAIPQAASAATVLTTGSYAADAETTAIGTTSLGVGRYRFTLTVTTPLDYLQGDIIKTNYFNQFADFHDGNGFVYIGGDDTPEDHSLTETGLFTYTTDVTVNPSTSTIDDIPGFATINTTTGESCCGYQIDLLAQASGTYTLSFNAVPEPATWMLMIVGFGMVGATMRGSRRTLAKRPA